MLATVVLTAFGDTVAGSVVINELMASNIKTKADPDGGFDDWIELYNSGTVAVDIGGMYLTDDLSRPTRWQVPKGKPSLTTIQAKGFLLIWADGQMQASGLHAPFSLSADGEQVAVFAEDGTPVDVVSFGRQLPDVSYGRWPDGSSGWTYMTSPTPGAANKQGQQGQVSDVVFQPHRGFYSGPIDVTLTTVTPGAQIWYTLDGNVPHTWQAYARGGGRWLGQVYNGPIRVTKTTCIRAVAIKTGWIDSPVVSHTYIYPDQVIRQPPNPPGFPFTPWNGKSPDYAMDPRVVEDPRYKDEIVRDLLAIPSVCIVIPNDDFFGQERGIYANGSARGDQWERACTMEWIDPCTGGHLGVNAGIRSHGGVGRGDVKHALRIAFRAEYGVSTLNFPLFEDSDITEFDGLVLRSQWNYSWTGDNSACNGLGTRYADYLREVFARDTCRDMGLVTPHARHVHLYINGLYWGLYLLSERPDERFASIHLGGQPEDYDVLKASNSFSTSGMEVLSGDLVAWQTLFSLADKDLSKPENYQKIQPYLDLPALIDYMLMIYYTGSRDAPVLLCNNRLPRNFYAIRRRDPPGGFVFLPWDVEWSLERPQENRVNITGVENPHLLISRLMANADFKILFADRVYSRLYNDGVLTPGLSTSRYLDRAGMIYGPIVCESARWGDADRPGQPYTREDWLFATSYLVDEYFPVRTGNVITQLKDQAWLPKIDPPLFKIDGSDRYTGQVRAGAVLTMVNPSGSGSIYYCLDGSDPRQAFTGQVWPSAIRYSGPITLKSSVSVKARVLSGSTWSGLTQATYAVGPVAECLRVTELMYNPARSSKWNGPADPNCEYIELTNIGGQPINLSLVRLKGCLDFTFPAMELAPGQCVVVVKDRLAFETVYGKQISIAGQYSGVLDNDGQWIELLDAVGQTILRFRYCGQWSAGANGSGYSLVLRDPRIPSQFYSEPWAWKASPSIGGSPGRAEAISSVSGPGPMVISEVMYHPYGNQDAEYIELVNATDKAVTLFDAATRKGWQLTDGPNGKLRFQFSGKASISVLPGRAVLLVKDMAAFNATFKVPADVQIFQWPDGGLDNGGDDLQLYEPISTTTWTMVDQVFYSDGLHPERAGTAKDRWPVAADGCGSALGRIWLTGPGNDPANWRAVEPSPGRP